MPLIAYKKTVWGRLKSGEDEVEGKAVSDSSDKQPLLDKAKDIQVGQKII